MILLVIAILALGFGIVKLISLPFGGISTDLNVFYGLAARRDRDRRARVLRAKTAETRAGRARRAARRALALSAAAESHAPVCGRYTLATPEPG